MPQPPMSRETMKEAADAVEKYGTVCAAARELGLPEGTMRYRFRQALQAGVAQDGLRVKGTSTLYGEKGEQLLQWVKTTEDKERYEKKIFNLDAKKS